MTTELTPQEPQTRQWESGSFIQPYSFGLVSKETPFFTFWFGGKSKPRLAGGKGPLPKAMPGPVGEGNRQERGLVLVRTLSY